MPADIRRLARGRTPIALAFVLLTAACSSGSPSPPPGRSALPTTGPRADACDVTKLDGWPKPGTVSTTGIIPVIASSQRVIGESRFVWTLINSKNQPIAAPDVQMEVGWFDLCRSAAQPVAVETAEFTWGITNLRGFYITNPTFSHAGTWGAAVVITDAAGTQTGAKIMFDVSDAGTTPAIGSRLTPVRSVTLADVGGDPKKLSSDPNPNPDFYRLSVDEALAQRIPFVLAMATPAFCTSAECGPTLDRIKEIVKRNPITVINVEPYQLRYENGRLQPVLENGSFVLVEATRVYGVPTEPWIFVIDGTGTVVGSFEAVVGEREMAKAIARAKGTP